jgi:hypothetical protein
LASSAPLHILANCNLPLNRALYANILEIVVINIFSVILIILGSLLGLSNWFAFIKSVIENGNTSFVPFLGGILFSLGIFLSPNISFSIFWWLGLVIDFTFLPMIVIYLYQKFGPESKSI